MKHLLLFVICYCLSSMLHAQERKYTVLFDFNQSNIPDSAMLTLIKLIAKTPIEQVLIEGHCDSIGSKKYNLSLSQRRAKEVEKLLTTNGISAKKIATCIGYGKDKPIVSNASEADRQLNRRVIVHFFTREVPTDLNKSSTAPLKQQEFKVGKTIVLNNLLFYPARHKLKPESKPVLENLCEILKKNPGLKIEIQGHVCCTTIEPDGYDIETRSENLSVTRAEAVFNYLVQECGIQEKRLTFKGFGGTQKVTLEEDTEEQMQKNRRVEIKITAQ